MADSIFKIDVNDMIFANALESMPGYFLITEAEGDQKILHASKSVLDLFECETEDQFMELTHGTFAGLVHPDEAETVANNIRIQIETGSSHFDHVKYRIITRNGVIRHIEDFGHRVVLADGREVFYVLLIDEDSKYRSYDIDPLTSLAGEGKFMNNAIKYLKMYSMRSDRPKLMFLYFNLLNFARINELAGIAEGDRVLMETAELLKMHFPGSLIGKLDNDHFAVLSEDHHAEDHIREIAGKLKDVIGNVETECKAGIYQIEDYAVKPGQALSYARSAAEQIRSDSSSVVAIYRKPGSASEC